MDSISIWHGKFALVRWCALLASVVPVTSGSAALAAPTILDFEDIAAGTTVTAQYGPRGVLFQNHYLDTDAAAHSGTHVLRTASFSNEIFTPIALGMSFTSAQARVKLFAESSFSALNGTLTAFDAADNVVASDGPKLVAQDVFTTMFEVIDPDATTSIVRAELRLENGIYFAIDDLEFEGEPPAPPPPTPPVVQITSPVNGSVLDVSSIDIAGTVTGEGLLTTANLTMIFAQPPESTAPPFTSALALTGTGTVLAFSLPGFTGVPLGPITVTVSAENFAAQQGSSSISFTNLPTAIQTRFTSEGGAATLGAFSFGIMANGCKIAVYEHGAISANDAGIAFFVRGDILAKWLTLRDAFHTEGFGCPLNEEHSAVSTGGSIAQDFTGGRIYANLPGTAYVPKVFVDVLDTRELEFLGPPTSVPMADPVSPVEPVQQSTQTWLYQQFIRPGRTDLVPATLEIQGSPPILWVERQSPTSSAHMGALWDHYPCSGNLGPCAVDAPATDFTPIPNAGDTFCGGVALHDFEGEYSLFVQCTADDFDLSTCGRPEWRHIKADDYLPTAIYGVITESHFADEDFIGSHEWGYCLPVPLRIDPLDCPSDWNLKVAPVGAQPGVAPFHSLFTEGNDISDIGVAGSSSSRLVELEYERFYGDFAEWMERPAEGDLLYAVGRWIIDCGHNNFAAELHPIYMFAKMKTVTSITDPFTGLVNNSPFGGQPATRADIWVNGWYPGGDDADHAIEFDIYPPPRPTPTARLVVNKPVDADAVHEVTIEYNFLPNHVHVKFTAPYRENKVTVWGEVKWEINRGYEGQWYLYWAP